MAAGKEKCPMDEPDELDTNRYHRVDGGFGRVGRRRLRKPEEAVRLAAQLDEAVRLVERAYVAGRVNTTLTTEMREFLARHGRP